MPPFQKPRIAEDALEEYSKVSVTYCKNLLALFDRFVIVGYADD